MTKKWTIAPGENYRKIHIKKTQLEVEDMLADMTAEYVRDKQDKKVLVMAEDEKTIYFLVFSEEGDENMEYGDVFLINPETDAFELLPRDISKPIVNAYLKHITALAGAYNHFKQEKGD